VGRPLWANCGLMRCNRARIPSCFRATPNGQWKFFDPLLKQAFPPAQPDLFLADEIERLRLAPPDGGAANYRAGRGKRTFCFYVCLYISTVSISHFPSFISLRSRRPLAIRADEKSVRGASAAHKFVRKSHSLRNSTRPISSGRPIRNLAALLTAPEILETCRR
jgi:hypothetical protein